MFREEDVVCGVFFHVYNNSMYLGLFILLPLCVRVYYLYFHLISFSISKFRNLDAFSSEDSKEEKILLQQENESKEAEAEHQQNS